MVADARQVEEDNPLELEERLLLLRAHILEVRVILRVDRRPGEVVVPVRAGLDIDRLAGDHRDRPRRRLIGALGIVSEHVDAFTEAHVELLQTFADQAAIAIANARLIDEPAELWPRDPPIRYRAKIPTAWLELTLREGKNRQVRRMTAKVGFPTLRLVRAAIGTVRCDGLAPGEWREVEVKDL